MKKKSTQEVTKCPYKTCDGSGWIIEDDEKRKCLCKIEDEAESRSDEERGN